MHAGYSTNAEQSKIDTKNIYDYDEAEAVVKFFCVVTITQADLFLESQTFTEGPLVTSN